MSNKVKNYRSSNAATTTQQPARQNPPAQIAPTGSYVPQYKQLGYKLEGDKFVAPDANVVQQVQQPIPRGNRNVPQTANRQPNVQYYAEPVQSPIGVGRNMMPNVGNNAERTWSEDAGDIVVDDLSGIDPNELIDNNDYVSDTALGLPSGEVFVKAGITTTSSLPQQTNIIPAQPAPRQMAAPQFQLAAQELTFKRSVFTIHPSTAR